MGKGAGKGSIDGSGSGSVFSSSFGLNEAWLRGLVMGPSLRTSGISQAGFSKGYCTGLVMTSGRQNSPVLDEENPQEK